MNVRNRKLEIVNLILVVGTITAIIFHYSKFAFIGDHSLTFSSFLHPRVNIFCDFYAMFDAFGRFKFNAASVYLPGAYLPIEILFIFTKIPYTAVQILLLFFLLFMIPYMYRSLYGINIVTRISLTFVLIFCNYAVLAALHTANFELLSFLLIAYAIFFRIKRMDGWSAALIGIAAAIKIFPAIFLLCIINKKNLFKVAGCFLISFLITLAMPFLYKGQFIENITTWFNVYKSEIDFYTKFMVIGYDGVHLGHSILNSIRLLMGPHSAGMKKVMPYFYMISPFLNLSSVYFILRSKNIYSKLILASCTICLFAPSSQDYKLLYFIIPLLILINSKRESKKEYILTILISLILIPKGYIYFYGDLYANTNVILDCLLLIALYLYSIPSLTINHLRDDLINTVPSFFIKRVKTKELNSVH